MKTAIIIPNYNGLRFLPACMDALDAQSCQDFFTLVVDNGSTDGSFSWLRAWQEKDPVRRHGIYLSENLGFPGAVNRGIEWAMGRGCAYVLLLNNDTAVETDFVRALVSAMDADRRGRIFALSSRMVKMHAPEIIDDAGDQYTLLGWAFQRGLDESAARWSLPARIFSACAGAAIYRVSALRETGLFDERHFAYLEDVDLSWRAQLLGYRVGYLPAAVCRHVGSGTSGSKYNNFKVRLAARNSIYILYKNMPPLQLLLNAPFLLAGILIKQLFFLRKGFGADYFNGLVEAAQNLKTLKKANLKEVSLLRYLIIELKLLTGTFEYLSRIIRRHSGQARG